MTGDVREGDHDGRVTSTSWNDVTDRAPALAKDVRGRFEATGLGYLATLRRDGSPRTSGIEPWFGEGELWIGSMWHALKAKDLLRDPRFSLHAANIDKEVADGDARISGIAEAITDDDVRRRPALEAFAHTSGHEVPPGEMHLFRLAPTEVVLLQPAKDHLQIRTWTPDRGERQLTRH
jgi:hypothetical protein